MKQPSAPREANDALEAALSAPHPCVEDDGFTRGVMERLPPRRSLVRLRASVLLLASALGALPLLFGPVRAFLAAGASAASTSPFAPSTATLAVALTMAVLTWSATSAMRLE